MSAKGPEGPSLSSANQLLKTPESSSSNAPLSSLNLNKTDLTLICSSIEVMQSTGKYSVEAMVAVGTLYQKLRAVLGPDYRPLAGS